MVRAEEAMRPGRDFKDCGERRLRCGVFEKDPKEARVADKRVCHCHLRGAASAAGSKYKTWPEDRVRGEEQEIQMEK